VSGTTITDDQFEKFCKDADLKTPQVAAEDLRAYHVPEAIVEALVERYEEHVGRVRELEVPRYMQDGARITWYTGPRPNDRFWPAFLDQLHYMDEEAKEELHRSTSRIVSLLDHPATVEFRTRGLVVGHVQSGKTTNYTGVIAKAADRGYRLIIVLAGIHNQLRRQTQERLQRHLWAPNKADWHLLTPVDRDFHPTSPAPAYFQKKNEQRVLCVVKKNASILRKLIRWLRSASKELEHIPALVIDDEADQATVATKTINPLLLELLDALPRVAYVGYTATPFANLLINPAGEDLYPKDFIVDLPKPTDHQGPEVIFGREPLDGEDPSEVPDGYDMVRMVPDEEIPLVRPASRDEIDGFAPRITGELKKAVIYFWLATAARRARGSRDHSTMLIHTSLNVAVHESFRPGLIALRDRTLERLRSEDAPLWSDLESQWTEETSRVDAAEFGETTVPFSSVREHLIDVVEATTVVLDNSRSEDRLDYSGEPVVAIAVGGNTLSRGLTLEGLVVSYFVRAATAYDTLMQMGRWFGYRRGYADLPRIWMTRELRDWFRFLAGIEAEIRVDIERYMTGEETPLTFGVRIQDHPTMNITAAAKMRDARMVTAAYGGMRIQTRYFPLDDHEWHRRNREAAVELVRAIGGAGRAATVADGHVLWLGVPAEVVLEFLDRYQMHEKSPDRDTSLIRRYVERRNERGALKHWNVAVIGSTTSGCEPYDFGSGVRVPKGIRGRFEEAPPADIKTLMSLRDAAIDLDLSGEGKLTEARVKALRAEQLPDTGLLTLYPLDRLAQPAKTSRVPLGTPEDVIGVGIVFPDPPPTKGDDKVYFQADLSRVSTSDGYLEEEDVSLLEDEQT
jgi:hypothetical protein